MKTITKKSIDTVIRATKKYADTGDADYLTVKHGAAKDASVEAFETDSKWLAISDLVSAIVGTSGLKKSATYEEIYIIFSALGYAVTP